MLHEKIKWVTRKPPSQPHITLKVHVDTRAYRENSIRPPSAFKHRTAELRSLADTGCQAVCIGPAQLSSLGLSRQDLMATEQRLAGANGSSIEILGALFVVISGVTNDGVQYDTRQLCYVCTGVNELLLSREACVKLGMIDSSFPAVGCATGARSVPGVSQVARVNNNREEHYDLEPCSPDEDGKCDCPRRAPCPEPPKYDPSLSVSELRTLIIRHYAASAFNRCTRQKLPAMQGEPLPILVKAGTKPVAVHTPVPVPQIGRAHV